MDRRKICGTSRVDRPWPVDAGPCQRHDVWTYLPTRQCHLRWASKSAQILQIGCRLHKNSLRLVFINKLLHYQNITVLQLHGIARLHRGPIVRVAHDVPDRRALGSAGSEWPRAWLFQMSNCRVDGRTSSARCCSTYLEQSAWRCCLCKVIAILPSVYSKYFFFQQSFSDRFVFLSSLFFFLILWHSI